MQQEKIGLERLQSEKDNQTSRTGSTQACLSM